jgi:hypothetical protein
MKRKLIVILLILVISLTLVLASCKPPIELNGGEYCEVCEKVECECEDEPIEFSFEMFFGTYEIAETIRFEIFVEGIARDYLICIVGIMCVDTEEWLDSYLETRTSWVAGQRWTEIMRGEDYKISEEYTEKARQMKNWIGRTLAITNEKTVDFDEFSADYHVFDVWEWAEELRASVNAPNVADLDFFHDKTTGETWVMLKFGGSPLGIWLDILVDIRMDKVS